MIYYSLTLYQYDILVTYYYIRSSFELADEAGGVRTLQSAVEALQYDMLNMYIYIYIYMYVRREISDPAQR